MVNQGLGMPPQRRKERKGSGDSEALKLGGVQKAVPAASIQISRCRKAKEPRRTTPSNGVGGDERLGHLCRLPHSGRTATSVDLNRTRPTNIIGQSMHRVI